MGGKLTPAGAERSIVDIISTKRSFMTVINFRETAEKKSGSDRKREKKVFPLCFLFCLLCVLSEIRQ